MSVAALVLLPPNSFHSFISLTYDADWMVASVGNYRDISDLFFCYCGYEKISDRSYIFHSGLLPTAAHALVVLYPPEIQRETTKFCLSK